MTTAEPSRRPRGRRAEQRQVGAQLRAQGRDLVEIAAYFQAEYRVSALAAMREARDWTQNEAADAWNRLFPDDPKTGKVISEWENWRTGYGRTPRLQILEKLARVYECRVSDLVTDCGDYRQPVTTARPARCTFVDERVVAAAFDRAQELEHEVQTRWPHAWSETDRLRAQPPGTWPSWCLLPSAAAAVVIGARDGDRPAPVAAVAALYAWRYSRSAYAFKPDLVGTLMAGGIDELGGIEAFARLPGWCMFIPGGRAEWPGSGLWAHLDYHAATGRPELRLVIDLATGGLDNLVVLPVYLDRPSLTEALADHRASLLGRREHAPGGLPDGAISRLADTVERTTWLVSRLAQTRQAPAPRPTQASARRCQPRCDSRALRSATEAPGEP